MKFPTIQKLQNDLSNTQVRAEMHREGWRRRPIIEFGGTEYIILEAIYPKPGHHRVEVINVTEFDRGGEHFKVFRLRPEPWGEREQAYVKIDEFIGLIATYRDDEGNEKLSEWQNPTTAVLTIQIVPPTASAVQETANELDRQLQDIGPTWGAPIQ